MKKLSKLIKSKNDFEKFKNLLINRVKENNPVSDNFMLDGFIISFIVYNKFVYDLFNYNLDEPTNVFDGTLQQLEQVAIWLINNEVKLIKILKDEN